MKGVPMNRFKRTFGQLIPSYSYLPLFLVFFANLLAFYATRPLNTGWTHYSLSLAADRQLPFIPFFILFYILAYFQWGLSYVLIARENRALCYRLVTANLIAKVLSAVIFLLLPTSMVRPEVTGTDLWSQLVRIIYTCDTPDNLFPSIHVLESWLCLRAAFMMKKPGRLYRVASVLMTLAVCASVLFVKQHLLLDILGGIVVMELGLLLVRITKADALFARFCHRLSDKISMKASSGEVNEK
jgi:hypothetical protein